MRVLVTGATGFVGHEVVRELRDAGHDVHALVRNARSPAARDLAARFGVQCREGNVLAPATLQPALSAIDAILHLVGIISEAGEQTFENVHVGGTKHVVQAAQAAGVKRFIYLSALGTRPNAVAQYHQSKWNAEEIVRQSGLDWTIFRPSIVFGPRDGFVNLLAAIVRRSPIVPVMGTGRTRFAPIAVEAVAQALAGAVSEAQAIGQTFDLCGPTTLSFDQVIDEILAVMGKKRLRLHVPWPVAWCQAALLEFLYGRLLRRPPPLNRDQLLMLQEDNVGNPAPAMALFKLKPTPFRQGISAYLASPPRS